MTLLNFKKKKEKKTNKHERKERSAEPEVHQLKEDVDEITR